MSHRPRPLLLGYIRAHLASTPAEIRRLEVQLEDFVAREEFSLGTVFVDRGEAPGAFHALIEELERDENVRGLLIPDLRHLSADEQLILSKHEQGARTPVIVVNFAPLAGGPGATTPGCSGSAILARRLTRRRREEP